MISLVLSGLPLSLKDRRYAGATDIAIQMKRQLIRLLMVVSVCCQTAHAVEPRTVQAQCLELTAQHPSYEVAISQLMTASEVQEKIKKLGDVGRKISHWPTFDKTVLHKGHCYWEISLYESDAEKMTSLGAYLVEVNEGKMFRLDVDGELFPLANQSRPGE